MDTKNINVKYKYYQLFFVAKFTKSIFKCYFNNKHCKTKLFIKKNCILTATKLLVHRNAIYKIIELSMLGIKWGNHYINLY